MPSLYSIVFDPLLQDLRTHNTNVALRNNCHKALDVCCGTGDQVFFYAREGIASVGIDMNPQMIKEAQEKKKRGKFDNTFFQLGDASSLPFEDNTFDLVSVTLGLHEMKEEKRGKTISSLKRVAKKDGFLLLADFQVPLPKNPLPLFLHSIEYLAGSENYARFKNYLQKGGLSTILRQNSLEKKSQAFFLANLIELNIIINN
ncbi:MAG: methyltransferase domain-containing protein [Candidatus Nealsonbacteria bacterium]|nr:methyltransferase domain-containing protein [Candidatus Nealsonbacteria bacterium]